MMLIDNLRLGLAMNASSTHSLAFIPGGASDFDIGDFGWNYFVAGSAKAKRLYLAVTVACNLAEITSRENALVIAVERLGEVLNLSEWGLFEPSIDHQSLWTLPRNWEGNDLDWDFVKALEKHLSHPNMVILGGNDNDGHEHQLLRSGKAKTATLPLEREGENKFLCARYDEEFGHWTLFHRRSGDKIRFFMDKGSKKYPSLSHAPELVDIKITNRCGYNCPYCYQASVPEGRHASANELRELGYRLSRLKVFEVAFGGGEPTSHPKFFELLGDFRDLGIVPNFTTRNLQWMNSIDAVNQVINYAGGFAYSVDKAEQVENLAKKLETADILRSQVSIQLVLGVTTTEEFQNILDVCQREGLQLTLLGFKNIGRGPNVRTSVIDDWIERCKNSHARIAVDTVLANEYEEELLAANVPSVFLQTIEGTHSMYIDVVDKKMGPSSYCDKDEYVFYEPTSKSFKEEELLSVFHSFRKNIRKKARQRARRRALNKREAR